MTWMISMEYQHVTYKPYIVQIVWLFSPIPTTMQRHDWQCVQYMSHGINYFSQKQESLLCCECKQHQHTLSLLLLWIPTTQETNQQTIVHVHIWTASIYKQDMLYKLSIILLSFYLHLCQPTIVWPQFGVYTLLMAEWEDGLKCTPNYCITNIINHLSVCCLATFAISMTSETT